VKFLADAMLGKLTRWLRMLAQDVIYSVALEDSELLELARKEDRILLTKDLELYKRGISRAVNVFYVEGKTESERLAKIAKRYNLQLKIDMDKSHCPVCNSKLQSTLKEQLEGKLEKNTFIYYDKFWKCPNCDQIYWQGAHWKQIQQTLNQTLTELQKLKEKN